MQKPPKASGTRNSSENGKDLESLIYDDIAAIVREEVRTLRTTSNREGLSKDEAAALFIYARVFAVLKDDLRADVKSGTTSVLPTNAAET